jgi:hypothetical protein
LAAGCARARPARVCSGGRLDKLGRLVVELAGGLNPENRRVGVAV